MKKIYLLFIFIMAVTVYFDPAEAQSTEVRYSYDASGNRTGRNVITLKSARAGYSADSIAGLSAGSFMQPAEDVLGEGKVLVYPNPAKDFLKVELTGTGGPFSLRLYNLSGRLLVNQSPAGNAADIDMSSYPGGTYVMKIRAGDKESEWKIVKN